MRRHVASISQRLIVSPVCGVSGEPDGRERVSNPPNRTAITIRHKRPIYYFSGKKEEKKIYTFLEITFLISKTIEKIHQRSIIFL